MLDFEVIKLQYTIEMYVNHTVSVIVLVSYFN